MNGWTLYHLVSFISYLYRILILPNLNDSLHCNLYIKHLQNFNYSLNVIYILNQNIIWNAVLNVIKRLRNYPTL